MKIEQIGIDELIPYARNPRKNDAAVDSVAASIKEFGFKQPIVIDAQNVVVAGHTRLKAAKKLGIKEIPCLRADDLTPDQIKAYRILDNKVAEKSEWDLELLPLELSEIELDLGPFEVEFDGDSPMLLDGFGESTADIERVEQITLTVQPDEAATIWAAIKRARSVASLQSDGNANGAAVAYICNQWLNGQR